MAPAREAGAQDEQSSFQVPVWVEVAGRATSAGTADARGDCALVSAVDVEGGLTAGVVLLGELPGTPAGRSLSAAAASCALSWIVSGWVDRAEGGAVGGTGALVVGSARLGLAVGEG